MDVKTAIKIVDSATAMLSLTRADHVKIQQAIAVIKSAVDKEEPPVNK